MGQNWYYAKSGNQLGPVVIEQLVGMLQASQLSPDDLVWTEGMAQWEPAGNIAELSAVMPQRAAVASPASPAAPQYAAPAYATQPAVPLSYQTPSPVELAGYAGFWLRFCAAFIDGIITMIAGGIIGGILGFIIGIAMASGGSSGGQVRLVAEAFGRVVGLILGWLYSAMMESSSAQATLGKMALGIRVTDLNGQRISFARATGRHFAKFISALILLIGYIMAGFTERKQALHDIMAGTLVVKKAPTLYYPR